MGCFARALAFLHTAPIVSEEQVTERARLAFAFLLALVLSPAGLSRLLPVHGLLEHVAVEALTGAVLGLALAWPWATVTALLPQLAGAAGIEDDDEEPSGRLSTAVALACFLSLSGDRFLVTLLAAPCRIPDSAAGLAELALRLGGVLYTIAADGLVPLLAVLAAARLAGSLVLRGGAMDLSGVHLPALTVAGVVLLTAFVHSAPLLYEDALHEGAAQVGGMSRRAPR